MCGLYFALCSGGEHRSLRLAPPQITVHEEGATLYLQYTEDCSKNIQGGLKHPKFAQKRLSILQTPTTLKDALFDHIDLSKHTTSGLSKKCLLF